MATIVRAPLLITLVHMGDSITFGEGVDPAVRWTTLIAQRLDAIYRTTPVNILSLNRGISGETTRMGLERFPADVQQVRLGKGGRPPVDTSHGSQSFP